MVMAQDTPTGKFRHWKPCGAGPSYAISRSLRGDGMWHKITLRGSVVNGNPAGQVCPTQAEKGSLRGEWWGHQITLRGSVVRGNRNLILIVHNDQMLRSPPSQRETERAAIPGSIGEPDAGPLPAGGLPVQ